MTLYIDLTASPYIVVADDPAKAADNTTAINQAIVDYGDSDGPARLVLPQGEIYIDQAGTNNWSLKFGTGIVDLTLAGQGMFATTLVQQGVGDTGEWNAIVIDRAQRIELCDFGVRQGIIQRPDAIQQNHLIAVYNNTLGSEETKDIYGHDLYLGQTLGDQLRFFGDTKPIENVHFTRLLMRGQVNAATPVFQTWAPSTAYALGAWVKNGSNQYMVTTAGTSATSGGGPTGNGSSIVDNTVVWTWVASRTGARSGLAIQRGYRNVEVDHFHVAGAQNTPIDMEPSGDGEMSKLYLHDFVADNTGGAANVAIQIGGVSVAPWAPSSAYGLDARVSNAGETYRATTAGTSASSGGPSGTGTSITDGTVVWTYVNMRATDLRVADGLALEGIVTVLGTQDALIDNLAVIAKAAFAADANEDLLWVRQINHNLTLRNLRLERIGSSVAGLVLSIENTGTRTLVDGGMFRQGTTAQIVMVDKTKNLRIRGVQLVYEGSSPGSKYGLHVQAQASTVERLQIDDVQVLSSTGKLASAVYLASRSPHTMEDVRVTNVHATDSATTAVYISVGSGSTFDVNPILQANENGTDTVWRQVDIGDNAITTLFPIVDGSKGTLTTRRLDGHATPNGNALGNIGDELEYSHLLADGVTRRTERWRKMTEATPGTPDTTGWELDRGYEISPSSIGAGPTQNWQPTDVEGADTIRVSTSVAAAIGGLSTWGKNFTANSTTNELTITSHNLNTGEGPFRVTNSGGSLPGGLLAGTDYWVRRTGANTLQLATSRVLALTTLPGDVVDLTSNGSGTQTMTARGRRGQRRRLVLVNVSANNLTLNNQDAASIDMNRFALPNAANLVIQPGGSVKLMFDWTSLRWRVEQ